MLFGLENFAKVIGSVDPVQLVVSKTFSLTSIHALNNLRYIPIPHVCFFSVVGSIHIDFDGFSTSLLRMLYPTSNLTSSVLMDNIRHWISL